MILWSHCSLCDKYASGHTVVAKKGVAYNICDACGSNYEKMRSLGDIEDSSCLGCFCGFAILVAIWVYAVFFVNWPEATEWVRIGLKEWLLK